MGVGAVQFRKRRPNYDRSLENYEPCRENKIERNYAICQNTATQDHQIKLTRCGLMKPKECTSRPTAPEFSNVYFLGWLINNMKQIHGGSWREATDLL